ncbi:MAG: hypothetical protein EOO13_11230, partial [Chitinophagaceae bacterium]
MKQIILYLFLAIFLCSCNETNNTLSTQNEQLKKENDSLKANQPEPVTEPVITPPEKDADVPEPSLKAGVHPISLQWISWDKKGESELTPLENGWFSIKGS